MKKSAAAKKPAIQSKTTEPVTKVSVGPAFDYTKWFPWIAAAFAFLLYINTVNHGYVLDDDTVMAKNTIVTKGIKAIPEIMTSAYRKGAWDRQESLYRPLSLIFFAIEWQVAPNQPIVGHLINILFYALSIYLLYLLLQQWMPQRHSLVILSATILFAVHPLHTEVVANIKSRDEILGLLFAILAFQSFHKYAVTTQIKDLALGSICFLLAVLSKESAITLFAVVPLSMYFFNAMDYKKLLIVMIALLVGVAIYFILRKIALGSLVNFNKIDVLNNSLVAAENPADRIATAVMLVGYYLLLFIFPHPLSFDYSLNTFPTITFSDYRFMMTMGVLFFLLFYILKNFRKKGVIVFGILFFGITLSIVSNIFLLIEATLAERFLFLPSLGLCLAVVFLMEKAFLFSVGKEASFANIFREYKWMVVLMGFILLLFSVKTVSRNADWKDNLTLFTADKEHNPKSYRVLSAYAFEFTKQKIIPLPENNPDKLLNCREAVSYLTQSLAIIPDNFKAWNLLAYCQSQLKDYPQVIHAFENGIPFYKNEPDKIKFYIMGVNAYYYTGNYSKATETCRTALQMEPNNAVLLNCLGMSLTETNQREEAFNALTKSAQLDSKEPDVWYNIGNWYAKGGDFASAIKNYSKTLQLDSNHINAMNNTGNCYAVLKQYEKAISCFEKIIQLNPGNKDAIRNMAATHSNLGNKEKAQEYLNTLQSLP
ncbi:MAG: tetratricopeptide repeat protein [Sphingobacteriales bacterium]|nr:tetratricopeptide repeat protein [Sphingobacteriales bacterium]